MAMRDTIQLESSCWRLWLQPSVGGQWLAGQVRRGADWFDVFPDCREAEPGGLAAANFHMLPYSNRIRDGHFRFNGVDHQLDDAPNHAIHGALRNRAWRVTECSAQAMACEYDSARDGEINWPWPITARLRYSLMQDTLHGEMSLTNTGETAMPAGMGWHPYFCRLIDQASPELQLPVSGAYPDTNGDCMPDGASIALPPALDFRTKRPLDPNQRIDHCLSGLHGAVHITWPEAGISLTLRASDNCAHLVFFNPDKPWFAVEPVTNATDAFNLAQRGIETGMVSLAPGETLHATMTLGLSLS